MADAADKAAKLQAAANSNAARYRRKVANIKPEGWCHDCGWLVAKGALFCNSECAERFERRERQRRMQ